mmetsp:Transcript_12019/g.17337  ORF Transcript_12019/g.17337 Transcript_12019/m.17337 type:complete len:95 (+) Transcript_12019:220-504(+)
MIDSSPHLPKSTPSQSSANTWHDKSSVVQSMRSCAFVTSFVVIVPLRALPLNNFTKRKKKTIAMGTLHLSGTIAKIIIADAISDIMISDIIEVR